MGESVGADDGFMGCTGISGVITDQLGHAGDVGGLDMVAIPVHGLARVERHDHSSSEVLPARSPIP